MDPPALLARHVNLLFCYFHCLANPLGRCIKVDALSLHAVFALHLFLGVCQNAQDEISIPQDALIRLLKNLLPFHFQHVGPAAAAADQAASGKIAAFAKINPFLDEASILATVGGEEKKHGLRVLPVVLPIAHDRAVAAIGEKVESFDSADETRTERVQMDIPHQFQQVRVLLTEDRFVAVLKEITRTVMTLVKRDGIPRQKAPHYLGHRDQACFQEQMEMIRNQRPSIAMRPGLFKNRRETSDKIGAVLIIPENR